MHVRRGLAALTVALTLLSGVTPVLAQVDEAEQRARDAGAEVDRAYAIVSGAVADADAVEAALFLALDEYQLASIDLSLAGIRLQQITESLAFADARALVAAEQLEMHTVTAYMEAVTSTASIVLDTQTVEDALFVGQVVRESQANALTTLGDLVVQRNELERIRAEHAVELVQVQSMEQRLASRAAELESLFADANADVAQAFALAAAADAAHRAALDEVDRAIAEENAARRAEQVTTTTQPPNTTNTQVATTTTADTAPPAEDTTTTTSATVASEWPPIPISDRTLAWRSLVEIHFAPDLVLDALVIIQCESHGDPNAINPYSGASGLFQFMPGTWAVASVQSGVADASVFDGEANIIAASWLAEYYRSRTGEPWRPWSCRSRL
jgi:soluble lytic murein transglycosylase-like protein